jgi:ribose transport system substrate-binding protein
MKRTISGRSRSLAAVVLGAILVAACGGSQSSGGGTKYVVGVSNTLTGNGWREEMICSIKAQARASGLVSRLVVANRNGGPAEQIQDIRSLISSGAKLIVINPSDPSALNGVIKEASQRGVVVVAVDQSVTAPEAYVVSNDQVAYGRIGADWLFKQLGGKGSVVEMRGQDGAPADSDRHRGFTDALSRYPGITVAAHTFTGWSLNPAAQQIKDLLSSGQHIDGVWTSGIDSTVVDTFQTANHPFVPMVGADNNKFIGQLVQLKDKGLQGAAVTNPPPVGAAGLAVGLQVLQGKKPQRIVKLTPELWDNTTQQGQQKLKQVYDPHLDPYYAVDYTVPQYTSYSKQDLTSCQGPS